LENVWLRLPPQEQLYLYFVAAFRKTVEASMSQTTGNGINLTGIQPSI
jgi:hypothetical protein